MAKRNTMAKFALTALLGAAPVAAQDYTPPEQRPAVCASLAKYTGTIMRGRQGGLPASTFLDDLESKPVPMRELIQRVVIAAWEIPQFGTREYKDRAVTEFASQWQTRCLAGKVFAWGEN